MNKTKHNFKRQTPTWLRVLCLTLLATWMGFQSYATTCAGAQVIAGAPTLPLTLTNACSGVDDITAANSTACGSNNYKGGQEAVYVWTPTGTYTGVSVASAGQTWTDRKSVV